MKITFKNVGQGDSIILEWERDGKPCFGLIDCNIIDGKNPVLDFLIARGVTELEFIVLSHFHYDHFSGLAGIFQHCSKNKIYVKHFFHSLTPFVSDIYNRIFTSQRLQAGILEFFKQYDAFDDFVGDKIPVSSHIGALDLTEKITMSFLAPKGKVYDVMAKQLARKVNKITTTIGDINKLSTIILIEEKGRSECVIVTSDAVKKAFQKVRPILTNAVLIQAPHHGSWPSIEPKFWNGLKKGLNCAAVFSVGSVPKDRLPNRQTVEYFDTNSFDVHATNNVFGISEYFSLASVTTSAKSKVLSTFSTLRKVTTTLPLSSKLNGDQSFAPF